MKPLVHLILAGMAAASPFVSLAQGTTTITREQVRAELIQLEDAGYHVGDGDQTTYPEKIQAAEAKISMQDSRQTSSASLGGATSGTSASGGEKLVPHSSCVGPVSFCSIYFGN
jgi:hypothetical protein